ncbi:serine hydrolase [Pedobacter yulinensis]|uniref:Serine hydrolase n=1 Tax=Pedobacter yulinensis TaxID=2126353 RepID=A0A2T3HN88_9SPHI|nr:serine hydrolase [Pedobacter yulinensis]PST83877.1 serine hydrolase [Pedobacter yulinensis]
MKKPYFLSALIFFSLSVDAQSTSKKLEHLMNTYYKLRKFNGTVFITQKGKVLLEKGFGYQNIKSKVPNGPQTIYQIASVTKPFTSTLTLKLVEMNKLQLTDRISKFYPNFPKGDSITVRHLLSHTSGISDHDADTTKKFRQATEEETFIEKVKSRTPDFSPGTDWRYSNSGYIMLGYIIQKVTQMSYYDAIRKYIFKPAGMRQSAFDFAALNSPYKATGYWVFPENDDAEPAKLINYDAPKAAGAIYSTVGDLYKFHKALQSGSLVSHKLLKEAYTPVMLNYGYGWIAEQATNKKMVSHSGDIWGFKAEFARLPEDDVCIIMLSNAEDLDLHSITFKLISILFNQPYQFPAQNKIQLDDATLNSYAGKYELRPGELIEVRADNHRLMATTGTTQEMYAQQKDLFLLDNGRDKRTVTFERDGAGNVISLSFMNGDQKMTCKKVK